MRTIAKAAIFGALLHAGFSAGVHACATDGLVPSAGSVNEDLNDYARIHIDADTGCAAQAASLLRAKISRVFLNPTTAYRRWLDGYNVALIFAAAQRIGANGYLDGNLNDALQQVARSYYPYTPDPGGACTKESGNACLDERVGVASAFAWIAAYKARQTGAVPAEATWAAVELRQGLLNETCVHNRAAFDAGDHRVLCNARLEDLAAGSAGTLSVNHGHQHIAYGAGLLTSVSSAVLGLRVAGAPYNWDPLERDVIRALILEGQKHIRNGQFLSDCATPIRDAASGRWTITDNALCGGDAGGDMYQPDMYRLRDFYERNIGAFPGGPNDYRFDTFNAGRFVGGSGFFAEGRLVTYRDHGYRWWVDSPTWMPWNYNAPKGYLDAIDSHGIAYGWTCDRDAPSIASKVVFEDQFGASYTVQAGGGSEPAVLAECGGGTGHRFSAALPWNLRGQIRAYGLDAYYPWVNRTPLPCLQSTGCTL